MKGGARAVSLAGGLALATAGVAAAGVLGRATLLSGSQTYTDDVGPTVTGAVEIHKVVVSNDDSGTVTVAATVDNRPAFLSTMGARLWLSPAAGNPSQSPDIWLNGDGSVQEDVRGQMIPAPPTVSASYANGVATFRVARSDLPGATFFFEVGVWDNAVRGTKFVAQDEVDASYTLRLPGATTKTSTTTTKAKSNPAPKAKTKAKTKKPKPRKKVKHHSR